MKILDAPAGNTAGRVQYGPPPNLYHIFKYRQKFLLKERKVKFHYPGPGPKLPRRDTFVARPARPNSDFSRPRRMREKEKISRGFGDQYGDGATQRLRPARPARSKIAISRLERSRWRRRDFCDQRVSDELLRRPILQGLANANNPEVF